MNLDFLNQALRAGDSAKAVSQLFFNHFQRITKEHGDLFRERAAKWQEAGGAMLARGLALDAGTSYWVDAQERAILVLDTLRRRGNQFIEHAATGMPPLLDFAYETIIDGRTLPRP